jgi:LysM repeat protein
MYPDDEQYESVFEERMADHFADAVARLEDGESVDSILASYTAQEANELRGMLHISASMAAIQHAPLPIRDPQRQAARREQFMEQLLLERTRQELADPTHWAAATPADYRMVAQQRPAGRRARRDAAPSSKGGPLGWWEALQDIFTVGNMRLAPIVITLGIALTSALGLWQATNASLPGDLTYPIKAWVKMMNLSMSDPDRVGEVSAAASETIQADFAESARRAEERKAAGEALEGIVHQESVFLVFEGFDGRLLKFGDIRVVPSYQPNPNDPASLPMVIEGDLQPGDQVWLTVQILPGQADVVQGVRAVVQAAEAETAPPPTAIPCSPRRPAGWGNYTVQRGDTLSALSVRSNASIRQIAGANCLESDVIIRGQLLYLPQAGIPPTPTVPAEGEPTTTPEIEPGPGGTVPLP